MDEVVIDHERPAITAPTIERQGDGSEAPEGEGASPDGMSEYERHVVARGFRKPPNRPAPKPGKPSIVAQGPPKAGQAPGETQSAAEGVSPEGAPEGAPAAQQAAPVDNADQFVDPDTHERYDGRTKTAKRIKTLLSERGRFRDENLALRSELADLRRSLADTSSGPAPKPTYQAPGQPPAQAANGNAEDPQPQLDQFQSWDEYQRAVTRWEVRQELQQHTSKTQQDQARSQERERFQQNLTAHQSRVAKAIDRFPDMLDQLAKIPAIPATQHVVRTIIESEIGPEIGYYLGSHPDVLRSLLEQPNEAAHLRMLGRIEAEVEKTVRGQAQPAVSRAPSPTRPVAGNGSAAVAGQGPEPGQEDVQAWRQKRGMGPSINRH